MKQRKIITLFLAIFLFGTTTFAQSSKDQFTDWINILNAGDQAKIEAFVADHFAQGFIEFMKLKPITSMLWDLHEKYPNMKIETFKFDDGKKIAGVVSSDQKALGLILNTNEEGKIIGWAETDLDSYGKKHYPKNYREITQFALALCDSLEQEEKYSASLIIGNSQNLLLQEAFGSANRSFDTPIDSQTKFNLASASKIFTSVAIGILFEQGKIDLEASVHTYLDLEIDPRIKVKHLLEHSSGLGDIFTEKYWQSSKADLHTWHDLFKYTDISNTSFPPGSAYQYSNTGFLVLGLLIEKVSGQSYFDFVKENIWDKLQMNQTQAIKSNMVVENKAVGYTHIVPVINEESQSLRFEQSESERDLWENTFFSSSSLSSPAGGAYSTASDIYQFINGLVNGSLISSNTLKTFTEIKTTRSFRFDLHKGYGYGFITNGIKDVWFWGHEGSLPGANTHIYYFPHIDISLIILSNSDNDAKVIFDKILNFMFSNKD